ncbi:alpha/beta fold hydrolase [Amycolatopsis jejuensis]|uniref:alpha/beta fold hydrolase n=1 Tax=Amycolatopsis jejuensis TaxID=330084 RepID=UPI00068F4F32|nr:alpha/beta hydrolase [Amycolatopsis jejuensis]
MSVDPIAEIPVKHEYAEVNGIRMHYVHGGSGNGRPLVLVHGLFETWRMWRKVLPRLLESYYVVAPDVRGYGETGKPGVEHMDKRTQAQDLRELADRLGLDEFVLIGHDRGARVCRRFALDHAERLRGLVLMDILPTEYIYTGLTARTAASHHWDQLFHLAKRGLAETLLRGHEEEYVRYFYERTPGFSDVLRSDGTYDHYVETIKSPGAVSGFLNDYRAAFDVDVPRYLEELRAGTKIEVPTQILWGELGNLHGQPAMDIWAARCEQLVGAEITGSGHYLPEERPAEVLAELEPFVDRCFGD